MGGRQHTLEHLRGRASLFRFCLSSVYLGSSLFSRPCGEKLGVRSRGKYWRTKHRQRDAHKQRKQEVSLRETVQLYGWMSGLEYEVQPRPEMTFVYQLNCRHIRCMHVYVYTTDWFSSTKFLSGGFRIKILPVGLTSLDKNFLHHPPDGYGINACNFILRSTRYGSWSQYSAGCYSFCILYHLWKVNEVFHLAT